VGLVGRGQRTGRTVRNWTATSNPLRDTILVVRPSIPAPRGAFRPWILALCLAAATSAPALGRPPTPPLEVQLVPLDALRPGATARFRVVVVPRFPADEIRIDVRPGRGVPWVSGARSLRVPARVDRPLEHQFAVRVPTDRREPLYVRIEATGPNGVTWRRGVGLGLGPDARADRARIVPDGRGGTTIEYEAAPARTRR